MLRADAQHRCREESNLRMAESVTAQADAVKEGKKPGNGENSFRRGTV